MYSWIIGTLVPKAWQENPTATLFASRLRNGSMNQLRARWRAWLMIPTEISPFIANHGSWSDHDGHQHCRKLFEKSIEIMLSDSLNCVATEREKKIEYYGYVIRVGG
jgi:hypothetical protein